MTFQPIEAATAIDRVVGSGGPQGACIATSFSLRSGCSRGRGAILFSWGVSAFDLSGVSYVRGADSTLYHDMESTMAHASAQIAADDAVGTDHVVQQSTPGKVLFYRSNAALSHPFLREEPPRSWVGRLCVAVLALIPIVTLIVAFGFALPHRSLQTGGTSGDLTLRDGFKIMRGPGSEASVLEGEAFSVLRVLSGAILVKPSRAPLHPLIVTTGDAQVELVDATLCARVQPNTTMLNVLTGSVQLSVNSPAVVSATQNGWRREQSLARPLAMTAGDRVEVTRRGSEVLLRLQRVPGSTDAQANQSAPACPPGAAAGATLG
jgi:hypothetical protein